MHIRLILAVVIATASWITVPNVFWAEPAFADNCVYTEGYYFDGASTATSAPLAPEGASAHIYNAGGYDWCPQVANSTNTVSSWSMITGANPNTDGYAQAGILFSPQMACPQYWSEQLANQQSQPRDDFVSGCATVGETHKFWNEWDLNASGQGHIQSFIDSRVLHGSGWDPFAYWTSPFRAEFESETHIKGSTVPGYTSSHQSTTAMEIQYAGNNGWYNTCGNAPITGNNSNPVGDWALNVTSCNSADTWTVR